jgi:hypothetical protein
MHWNMSPSRNSQGGPFAGRSDGHLLDCIQRAFERARETWPAHDPRVTCRAYVVVQRPCSDGAKGGHRGVASIGKNRYRRLGTHQQICLWGPLTFF